jgi:hypothetical protein
MNAVFGAIGVDYDQWRALTIVALKLDFRQGSFGRSRFSGETRGVARILIQVILYSAYGLFLSFLLWAVDDLFLAGTFLATYVMFMVGMTVLLGYNSVLTSPLDYGILGFRPVTSRTYFAARLTNALVYTSGLTTAVAYIPIVTLFVRHGAAVGTAGIAATYGASLFTALSILFGYGGLMHLIGADALKRALSYVQMAMSFVVYGGYFLSGQLARSQTLRSLSIPKSPWLVLAPPTWFASYLDIAAGRAAPIQLVIAAISVVAGMALVVGAGGRLSMTYSDRLAAIAASSQRVRHSSGRAGRGWWFRRDEPRAVAVLVRSQFRNDQRFRMGVLGILPLTLLYAIMGIRDGNMADPFAPARGGGGFSLVTVAILVFPSMLKPALTRSESFRASWVFFACPADRLKIIRSAKNVVVAYFLVPYLLFVGAIYAYVARNLWHVLVHIMLLGLISHLVLQCMVFLDPELPFSRPPQTGRRGTSVVVLMLMMGLTSGLLQSFSSALYASVLATTIAFASVIGITAVVDLMTRARVRRHATELEFEG